MKIIANDGGVATGKIYNIGNPANNFSVRELATMMLDLALTYPEYRDTAERVRIVETTADRYYGTRLPGRAEPRARRSPTPAPTSTGSRASRWTRRCKRIFDAYRGQVAEARHLVD